jgi:hypothetical protein
MFRRRDAKHGAETEGEATKSKAEEPETSDVVDDVVDFDEEFSANPIEDQPEDMTADLESQAADYLKDNDAWMYGPNAAAVLDILDRLEGFGPDEAKPLAEAWLAIPKSDRDRARKAAQKLAENDEEIYRYLQLAREAVGTWAAVTGPFPDFVNAEPNWGRICSQSAEAALDAATAVILEGTLEEAHYEALLEPWSETMATLDDAAEAAEAARIEGADAADDEEEEEEEEGEEKEGEVGPNTDSITDFLTRLWLLTPEQIGRLVGGWQNADRELLKGAHERLRALVEEDPDWRDQVRKAQEKLAPWLNAGRVAEQAGFLGQAGQGESRKMAGPALADAVAALVLGDLLERADAEVLYGAWFNLIGAPALPVASEEDPDEDSGE